MANPVGDSYGVASGGVIAAGRYRFPANARISIWGQSNAIGRAVQTDISASPLSSDAGLATFLTNGFDRVFFWNGSAYAKLTATNNGCDAGQFGAEFGLAVRWMRETTSGNLYIEKEAASGVSIDPTFDPAQWYYTGMVTRRASMNSWLSANGITATDSGFLWIQGEADSAQTQSWYQTRLENLLSARTTDGLQTTSTKRLLMQMAVGSVSYSSSIAAAKTAIASASSSNTFSPSMPYYMKADNIHQNGRGQVQAGYDAFELIFNRPHIAT